MDWTNYRRSGFTLVEVVVASAVMLFVFTALFASVIYTLGVISNSQAKLSALSLATDRIEYIRSLPYDSVGTIAGIPSGSIPQNRVTTLNGFTFAERVLIEFVDAPQDGLGGADRNGILADFKQVKVEYTWQVGSSTPQTMFLISRIVPRSIETTAGGGTIRVRVEDYLSNPMPGASVRLVNKTTTSTIDVTRLTDATGYALFAGAPAAANYEVYVSRAGYSLDQTYTPTTTLPISVFPPITLLESDITDVVFSIDKLSDLTIRSYSNLSEGTYTETFLATSSIMGSSTNVEVLGGQLVLTNNSGVYNPSGIAYLDLYTPGSLDMWGGVFIADELVSGASYKIQLYAGSDESSLIPDSDMLGNSGGLLGPYISLRHLSTVTYPSLRVKLTLTTSNSAVTPEIESVSLWYFDSVTPRVGQTLVVVGSKNIGQLGDGTPVPKFSGGGITNSNGELFLNNIEWGGYRVSSAGFDIAMVCTANPIDVSPDSTNILDVHFVPDQASTVRVRVLSAGVPLPGATVELRRPGFSDTATTSICGQVFFNTGVVDATDYELQVSAPGYGTAILNSQSISGDTFLDVTL